MPALLVALLALPFFGPKPPPPPPPLPPLPALVLPADAPIITATIDGQPLRLRVDPATTSQVALNASAARRLDLANPARLVAGEPAADGKMIVMVGKVSVPEVTTTAVLDIAGRPVPVTLAFGDSDHVAGADGSINPVLLPHDEIRMVRRPATATDRTTVLPVAFNVERGLVTERPVGKRRIDVIISPQTAQSVATAAAAAFLADAYGGQLSGPVVDVPVSHGISRPARTVTFARPPEIAGFRFTSIPARLFDWSGKTRIPAEQLPDDELVATARFDGQRQWAKFGIGNDRLASCAEISWRRKASTLTLVCPDPR